MMKLNLQPDSPRMLIPSIEDHAQRPLDEVQTLGDAEEQPVNVASLETDEKTPTKEMKLISSPDEVSGLPEEETVNKLIRYYEREILSAFEREYDVLVDGGSSPSDARENLLKDHPYESFVREKLKTDRENELTKDSQSMTGSMSSEDPEKKPWMTSPALEDDLEHHEIL
jgi:hypothetical protein